MICGLRNIWTDLLAEDVKLSPEQIEAMPHEVETTFLFLAGTDTYVRNGLHWPLRLKPEVIARINCANSLKLPSYTHELSTSHQNLNPFFTVTVLPVCPTRLYFKYN